MVQTGTNDLFQVVFMNVTIREIAQKAGVSMGTVDRVLNGRPGVKPGGPGKRIKK